MQETYCEKDFRDEFALKGIICEMRVITDVRIRNSFHDRWIISRNVCYNMPSVDTIMRGQYSEIKETEHKPPFEEWWEASTDIMDGWNQLISQK